MRANLVGRSAVSAITQTPASGPLGLVTTPPMSSGSIWTWAGKHAASPKTAAARYNVLCWQVIMTLLCWWHYVTRWLRPSSALDNTGGKAHTLQGARQERDPMRATLVMVMAAVSGFVPAASAQTKPL